MPYSQVVTNLVSAVLAAFVMWCAARLYRLWERRRDSGKVRDWLRSNTRDESGDTHRSTLEISTGTRLPEVRVLQACLGDPQILRSQTQPNLWSIWRKEPPSVYEKRGLITI